MAALDYDAATPNVCFKAEFAPPIRASVELPRLVTKHLGARVGPIKRVFRLAPKRWTALLEAGDKSFTLVLRRNKHKQDEWVILIGSNNIPLKWARDAKVPRFIPQLRLVCRELNALLAATPGITRVRWYFQGWGDPGDAFLTPDELPWDAIRDIEDN